MKTFYPKTYLIFICFTLLVGVISCSKDDTPTENNLKKVEPLTVANEILQLVNNHRLSIGKNLLQINALATDLAIAHTEYMITQNDISHDNFEQRSNQLFAEENANRTGENVAYGQRSAATVMEAWLNSPEHRKNIEGDFTHIGIAAVNNATGTYFFTQLFFKKRTENTST